MVNSDTTSASVSAEVNFSFIVMYPQMKYVASFSDKSSGPSTINQIQFCSCNWSSVTVLFVSGGVRFLQINENFFSSQISTVHDQFHADEVYVPPES